MMERRIEQIKCYWWLYVILLWPYAYLSINQFPPPFSINQIDELLIVFVGFYMLTDTLVVRHWNKVKRARKDDFDSSTYNTRGDNYKQRRDGGSNSNSNDQSSEYDFDSARWDKSRFDDERYEKKYQSIYRAAHDPKTAPEERKRYFNALVDADSGKMKGIKALPAPN